MDKKKILIVDDELSVRDSLSNWFAADGYDVSCAENAVLALEQLEQKEFQIILMLIVAGILLQVLVL